MSSEASSLEFIILSRSWLVTVHSLRLSSSHGSAGSVSMVTSLMSGLTVSSRHHSSPLVTGDLMISDNVVPGVSVTTVSWVLGPTNQFLVTVSGVE